MTPPPTTLPLSLFWTLEGGGVLTLILLQALALRSRVGGVSWLLLAAIGTLLAMVLLLLAVQVGQVNPSMLDSSALFTAELLGLVLASMQHLLLSCLWPVPPPPAPIASRQEGRRSRR